MFYIHSENKILEILMILYEILKKVKIKQKIYITKAHISYFTNQITSQEFLNFYKTLR